MTTEQYAPSSPYATTRQTTWFLSNLNFRDIPSDSSDSFLILSSKYNFRPDLLSYDLYGTVDYWWTFMILNPDQIADPIYDFATGKQIYTATAARLAGLLGN